MSSLEWDEIFSGDEDDEICDCPKCGRTYDEIDQDYLICSKCGWDVDKNKYSAPRNPSSSDYLSGDADILTGEFY